MCEGFEIGRDWMYLSDRKKIQVELVKRAVRAKVGIVGNGFILQGFRLQEGFWFLIKEYWEVLKGFKWVRGDIL